jgi:hypothetical protein
MLVVTGVAVACSLVAWLHLFGLAICTFCLAAFLLRIGGRTRGTGWFILGCTTMLVALAISAYAVAVALSYIIAMHTYFPSR